MTLPLQGSPGFKLFLFIVVVVFFHVLYMHDTYPLIRVRPFTFRVREAAWPSGKDLKSGGPGFKSRLGHVCKWPDGLPPGIFNMLCSI